MDLANNTKLLLRQKFKNKINRYDRLSILTLIKADIARYGGWKKAIIYFGFWVVLSYRISHSLYKIHLNLFSLIIQYVIVVLTFSNINRKAIIGPGLRINHPTNIFIGPHVYIGRGCSLRPRLFIASKFHAFDPEDYPVIGDYCKIAVGSVILGNVTIGDGVWVGPNAVITKDIPDKHDVVSPTARAIPRDSWKK